MKRRLTIYSHSNRCPLTNDYDPKTVSPYGTKWLVTVDTETMKFTAQLLLSNWRVNEEKFIESAKKNFKYPKS